MEKKFHELNTDQVLVVHPDIYAFGGAELVAVRIIYQLAKIFKKITVIHLGGPLDAARIYAWSNIRLDESRIVFQSPAINFKWIGKRGALIKYSFALRSASRIAGDYQLVISTYGECTFDAKNVIQYIHFPLFIRTQENFHFLGARNLNWFKLVNRHLYNFVCQKVARWKPDVVKRHVTLTNSDWSLKHIEKCYNLIKCTRLYPGASVCLKKGHVDYVPWPSRSDGFVMLGRIVPNKQIEKVIKIINRINDLGYKNHLHIIGNGDSFYLNKLKGLIEGKNISLHVGLSRVDVEKLISRQKYGIHGYDDEHYGIAVAEMQMLGCIVFVPDSGGQCEIARSRMQQYHSVDDAVEKILNVVKCKRNQDLILGQIDAINDEMSIDNFNINFVKTINANMSHWC